MPGRHPANHDCLITRVQQQYPQARIVHRLDMDTSGIMVLGLDADSHRALSKQFEQRQIKKEYIAVVYGLLEEADGTIELPMIGDWPRRPRQKVDFDEGKQASTLYRRLSLNPAEHSSRVELRPLTGRSHQLRVHMAEIGHPILGCNFYAHEQARQQSKRLLLHTSRLTLNHPRNAEILNWQSPSPF